MSDSLAVAAITARLRDLLDKGLNADVSGTTVTTRPLDKARANSNGNQVNLFLYHTMTNAAWRNTGIPWQVKPGETGQPPLALNLHYLVTAYYGENEDDIDTTTDENRLLGSHRLLGRAMSILHDHPVLDTAAINAILPADDQLEHPYDQVERVRITPQPLSLDDMYKLWGGFQTQYRLSAAYEVSVILIESTRPAKTPLPVLTRSPDDEGIPAQADLTPPFPGLEAVQPPANQPSARLGDVLRLGGHHLQGDEVVVLFYHPRLEDPNEVPPLPGGTATETQVELPNEPPDWPAGFYTLAVGFKEGGNLVQTTNERSFALAPRILSTTFNPPPPELADKCDVMLTLTCSPEVRPAQRAVLLLGDREILAQPHPAQTDTLEFCLKDVPPGDYFVRLRIDGVDSLLIDRTAVPPVFDETQKVTIP